MVTAFRCALELGSPATSGLPPRMVAARDTYHEMLFVVEASSEFLAWLGYAGLGRIATVGRSSLPADLTVAQSPPAHSPLQTTLQMNYRLRPATNLSGCTGVHQGRRHCTSQGAFDNSLPPPAALSPLEPLAGHYILLISQSKSRPRGRYTIPNLAHAPRLRRYSVRSPIGRRLSALPALTASTPRFTVALSFVKWTRLASPLPRYPPVRAARLS